MTDDLRKKRLIRAICDKRREQLYGDHCQQCSSRKQCWDRDKAGELLAAHDADLEAAGYQIVPKKPTAEMLEAWNNAYPKDGELTDDAMALADWLAMLAAAPKAMLFTTPATPKQAQSVGGSIKDYDDGFGTG